MEEITRISFSCRGAYDYPYAASLTTTPKGWVLRLEGFAWRGNSGGLERRAWFIPASQAAIAEVIAAFIEQEEPVDTGILVDHPGVRRCAF